MGSYVGGGVGIVAPWAVGIGGARAAGALPKVVEAGANASRAARAAVVAQKGGLLAGEGATMGAVTPVTDGDWGRSKAIQVGGGAVAGPLLAGTYMAGGKALGAANTAKNYLLNPEAVANSRLLRDFGGDNPLAAVQQLRNAPSYFPGDTPTAAQVLGGGQRVAAERNLRNNPVARDVFADADAQQAQLREGIIQRLAGTDAEMEAAKVARR